MNRIIWDESYSVKNAELDRQHQKWIAIINDLHNILMYGDLRNLQDISEKTLNAMMEYVRFHFTAEEKYMQEIHYPDLTFHRDIHAKFYIRVKELHSDVRSGRQVLNTEIMKTLTNWLQQHILNEDMKYCRFVSSLEDEKTGG